MPDYRQLRPGDRIRLLAVPQTDLDQRVREKRNGLEDAGWTADTIERILAQDPVVTIDRIDEYGYPWFEYVLLSDGGDREYHSIMVLDDHSWEFVG
ncbi:MAG: hypothetical protein KC657_22425 [Myxococcales bacterium]|nr:hypothetical protein [Myxococcales bacterium]MCB9609435.1 hypothetical protein [Polyangiaceae bacterium]